MTIYYGNDIDQINNEVLSLKNVKKITYEDDQTSIIDNLSQLTLFDSFENVVIYDADFLLDKSDEANKLINFLINFDIPVFCLVENDKLDKFNPLVIKNRQVDLIKKTKFTVYNKLDQIKQMCKDLNLQFDSNITFNILIQSLPTNFLLIKSELNKLKMFVQDKKVTKSDLDDILLDNLEANIFKLVNYLLTNNQKDLLNLYDKLISLKHQPVEIIQIVSTQLMKFKLYKLAMVKGYSMSKISTELSLTPYQIKQMSFINKISLSKINKILDQLYKLDSDIKKSLVDPFQSLKFYLVSCNLE